MLDLLLLAKNKLEIMGVHLGVGASINMIAVNLQLLQHHFEDFLILLDFLNK